MKIFSLQSKTSLIAHSVVLGVVVNCIISILTYSEDRGEGGTLASFGWPYRVLVEYYDIRLILGIVFWIIVALIILTLIRHFRNKKA